MAFSYCEAKENLLLILLYFRLTLKNHLSSHLSKTSNKTVISLSISVCFTFTMFDGRMREKNM